MATAIHTEIKNLAGSNPAAYLSISFLEALIIKRALISIQKITGVEIPVGQQLLSASLDRVTFTHPPIGSTQITKPASSLPNQIGLSLNSDLAVIVKIFIKSQPAKLISTVTVSVQGLIVLGSYANNVISFEGVDFTPLPTVVRDPSADQLLHAAGIDPLEAARVEGLIAYSAVNSSIGASLAQRKEISLGELFPAFDFGTAAQLVPLGVGKFLGIIPDKFAKVETAACTCASGPDLPVSGSSNTITVPANPHPGTSLGSVTIGGPVPESIDPLRDLGPRFVGSGLAGVYMPRVAYEGLTVQVMPAISVHASDNGFIGFDAFATVGFSGVNVTLDVPKGGIIVSVNMEISVQATCTLDMGCGIRLPIGFAIIRPDAGSNAKIEMGFYPAVDQSGAVKLRGILQSVDTGRYVAVIVGIGTALKIIGVTAWIGFLIDVVLSTIVSHKLPDALRDEVKKYLGQNEWKLLRFGELVNTSFGPSRFTAPFDVDVDTILASIGADS